MLKLAGILILILLSPRIWADPFTNSEAATYLMMRDLRIAPSSMPQVVSQSVETFENSEVVRVVLQQEHMPALRLTLRGPKGFAAKRDRSLNGVFVAAGFFTGADASLLLGEVPNTVFVGFDYPYQIAEITQDPAKLLQTFRLTPGQIALAIKWVSTQSWLKAEKFAAVGVSMGGLYLPAALHMAQKMNTQVPRTIFAFTGADIKNILGNILKDLVPEPALPVVLVTIPAVNTLSNPEIHLPYLQGSFLVLYSDRDQVIPRATSEKLFTLLPGPKKFEVLNGPHVDIDQPEIIQQLKNTVLTWLAGS